MPLHQLPIEPIALSALQHAGFGLEQYRGDLVNIQDLVDSIRNDGLTTPPIVWRDAKETKGQCVIVDGHRRVAALRAMRDKWDLANGEFPIDPVLCVMTSGPLRQVQWLQVAHRLDSNISPPDNRGDQAVLMSLLMQPEFGYSETEIRDLLGESQPWASFSWKYTTALCPAALDRFRHGTITQAQADKLIKLAGRVRDGRWVPREQEQLDALAGIAPPAKATRRRRT